MAKFGKSIFCIILFVGVFGVFAGALTALMALLGTVLITRGAFGLGIGLNDLDAVLAEVVVAARAVSRETVKFSETVLTELEWAAVAEEDRGFGLAVGAEFHLVLVGS